jgi:hypothetical protein
MGKKQILVNLDESLIERINAVAPDRGRSEWIGAACEARLAGGGNGHPPTGDDDAAIWQAAAAAILEAWRLEREDAQATAIAQAHGGNGRNGNGHNGGRS